MRSPEHGKRLYRTGMEKAGISVFSGLVVGSATQDILCGVDTSVLVGLASLCTALSQDLSLMMQAQETSTYNLGRFGNIDAVLHRGDSVRLNDGAVIQPGDIIGHINLSKNLESSLSQSQFTGAFLRSFSYAMVRLANDVEHKHFPIEIKAITGTTHMGSPPTYEDLGFTVRDEKNLFLRLVAAKYGTDITRDYDSSESYLQLFKREWNHVHTVWMSREQIVASKPLFQDLRSRLKNSKSFNALTA